MRRILILVLFIVTKCSLAQTGMQKAKNVKIEPDTSNIAILPYDTSFSWLFKNAHSIDLSANEMLKIETILTRQIDKYNTNAEKRYKAIAKKYPEAQRSHFVIDLTKYRRQYIAVIDSTGQKLVWVNCFCIQDPYWRTQVMDVNDGGNCFFQLKIQLPAGRIFDFNINGDA